MTVQAVFAYGELFPWCQCQIVRCKISDWADVEVGETLDPKCQLERKFVPLMQPPSSFLDSWCSNIDSSGPRFVGNASCLNFPVLRKMKKMGLFLKNA